MKQILLLFAVAGFIGAGCRKQSTPAEDILMQRTASQAGNLTNDEDGAYCTCNPCNPNVSWNNIDVELNPKFRCYTESCTGSLINFSEYNNRNDWVYSTLYPAALIPLSVQTTIINAAVQRAHQHRPPGKIIVRIELIKDVILSIQAQYIVYTKVTYANCSGIGSGD